MKTIENITDLTTKKTVKIKNPNPRNINEKYYLEAATALY